MSKRQLCGTAQGHREHYILSGLTSVQAESKAQDEAVTQQDKPELKRI